MSENQILISLHPWIYHIFWLTNYCYGELAGIWIANSICEPIDDSSDSSWEYVQWSMSLTDTYRLTRIGGCRLNPPYSYLSDSWRWHKGCVWWTANNIGWIIVLSSWKEMKIWVWSNFFPVPMKFRQQISACLDMLVCAMEGSSCDVHYSCTIFTNWLIGVTNLGVGVLKFGLGRDALLGMLKVNPYIYQFLKKKWHIHIQMYQSAWFWAKSRPKLSNFSQIYGTFWKVYYIPKFAFYKGHWYSSVCSTSLVTFVLSTPPPPQVTR